MSVCVSVLLCLFSRVYSRMFTLARVLINNLASLQSFYYILYGPWEDTSLLRPKKRPRPFSNIVVPCMPADFGKVWVEAWDLSNLGKRNFVPPPPLTTYNPGSRAVTGASRIQPTEEQDILGFT